MVSLVFSLQVASSALVAVVSRSDFEKTVTRRSWKEEGVGSSFWGPMLGAEAVEAGVHVCMDVYASDSQMKGTGFDPQRPRLVPRPYVLPMTPY